MPTERPTGWVAQWPPEVPPFRPPGPPLEPPQRPMPGRQPPSAPQPILPTWEEYEPTPRDRDLVDRLLERRVVTVAGRVDDELANRVATQLLVLGESDEPIELHLSCPDSELAASLALADAVDMAGPPVHALVRGTLRGPAVAVLCACDRRAAHRNALFVLYLPTASAEGTSSDLASLAEQHRHQVGQLRGWVARTTGQDSEDVAHDLEAGRLLSADEARDYHLVDELL